MLCANIVAIMFKVKRGGYGYLFFTGFTTTTLCCLHIQKQIAADSSAAAAAASGE